MDLKPNLRFLALLCFIVSAEFSFSQEISDVFLAGEGDNWSLNPVGSACPTIGFNTYNFSVSLRGDFRNTENNNAFILELSDADGNFTDPATQLSVVPYATTGPGRFNNSNFGTGNKIVRAENEPLFSGVSLPIDVASENYLVRVRSTNPETISDPSPIFSAYYYDGAEIRIYKDPTVCTSSNPELCLLDAAAICGGSNSITLTATPLNGAVVNSYIWRYQQTNLDPWTVIAGENSASISVNTEGIYRAFVNLGYCIDNPGIQNLAGSNQVNLTVEGADFMKIADQSNEEITSTINICEEDGYTFLAKPIRTTDTYKWFKDGELLATPSPPYELNIGGPGVGGIGGNYHLEVTTDLGCTARSQDVTVAPKNPQVSIDKPAGVLVFPGEQVTLNLISSVLGPTIQWFKEGNALPGETTSSLLVDASEFGTYTVRITAPSECSSETYSAPVTIFTPTNFEATINFAQPGLAACETSTRTLLIEELLAIADNGTPVVVPANKLPLLSLNWILDTTSIDGATDSTYLVSAIEQTGTYRLAITSGGVTSLSNELEVSLQVPVIDLTPSEDYLCAGSSVTLTALTNDFTYEWYFNEELITGQTTNVLTATQAGEYQVIIQTPAGCPPSQSEVFDLQIFNEDVITVDPGFSINFKDDDIAKTVIASGAENYEWFLETNDANGLPVQTSVSTLDTIEIESSIFSGGVTVVNYILKSTFSSCEAINTVTVRRENSTVFPNLVTPNADGQNDRWVIPKEYVNNPDVEITIYRANALIDFSTSSYQNDWPENNSSTNGKEAVYYYFVNNKQSGEILKGSITVMK